MLDPPTFYNPARRRSEQSYRTMINALLLAVAIVSSPSAIC